MILSDAEAKALCDVRRLLTDVLIDLAAHGLADSPVADKIHEARKMVREVMS